MLLLNFRSGDYVMIGDDIKIRVEYMGGHIRLAFDAPKEIPILRQTIYEQWNPDYKDEHYPRSIVERKALEAKAQRRAKQMEFRAAQVSRVAENEDQSTPPTP